MAINLTQVMGGVRNYREVRDLVERIEAINWTDVPESNRCRGYSMNPDQSPGRDAAGGDYVFFDPWTRESVDAETAKVRREHGRSRPSGHPVGYVVTESLQLSGLDPYVDYSASEGEDMDAEDGDVDRGGVEGRGRDRGVTAGGGEGRGGVPGAGGSAPSGGSTPAGSASTDPVGTLSAPSSPGLTAVADVTFLRQFLRGSGVDIVEDVVDVDVLQGVLRTWLAGMRRPTASAVTGLIAGVAVEAEEGEAPIGDGADTEMGET